MLKRLKTPFIKLIQKTKEFGKKVGNVTAPAVASTTAFLAEKDLLNWA